MAIIFLQWAIRISRCVKPDMQHPFIQTQKKGFNFLPIFSIIFHKNPPPIAHQFVQSARLIAAYLHHWWQL